MSFILDVKLQNRWRLFNPTNSCIRRYPLLANIRIVRYLGTCKSNGLRFFMSISLMLILINPNAKAQNFALKTNMLYDVLSVPSLGCEVAVEKHFSAGIMCTYNPIRYGDKKGSVCKLGDLTILCIKFSHSEEEESDIIYTSERGPKPF